RRAPALRQGSQVPALEAQATVGCDLEAPLCRIDRAQALVAAPRGGREGRLHRVFRLVQQGRAHGSGGSAMGSSWEATWRARYSSMPCLALYLSCMIRYESAIGPPSPFRSWIRDGRPVR